MGIINIKQNWFDIAASIFLLWGVVNTFFGISRYGIEQGMYFWFCNLALFAVAYGLWKKNTSWLIAWLSFAIITQSFWIVDNIWRIATEKNLFGLIEFMYQPGYPLDEFLISHYHFFIIPTIVLALLFFKQTKHKTIELTIVYGIVILVLSYLFFPKEQNINCIRESCFPILENWRGPVYSLIYSLSIILLASIVAFFIEKIHKKLNFNKKQKVFAVYIFCSIVILSFGLIIADISYKMTLPTLNCQNSYEISGVKISCKYTSEYKEQQMLLIYSVENQVAEHKLCTTKIIINGKEEVMHQNIYIEPYKKYSIGFVLPYPKENVKAKLSVSC